MTKAGDKLEQLASVERQMADLDLERLRLIAEAQSAGASWESIGAALGITKQSAWETYRMRIRQLLDAASASVDLDEAELLDSAATTLGRVRARRKA